jgi:hypothetical protein
MNSNVKEPFISMESEELRELVKEVNETVATNANEPQVFSAADLWRIQKLMRTAQSSRRTRDIPTIS